MDEQYPKCELCDKPGVAKRSMFVDVDYEKTDEGDGLIGVRADVWLCADHVEAYDSGDLN